MFNLKLSLLFVFAPAVVSAAYDWTYGNITLMHSESAYCDYNNYMTKSYKGLLADFVPTYSIYDPSHDTHGYIGYSSSQQAIYVAFRGSESVQNWIDNLDVVLTPYPLCSGCNVHKGFYEAEQSSIAVIIKEVKSLKSKYPSYPVILTGHSLGAALATLTTMDLMVNGVTPVRMFNYGSPRVGDDAFAAYVSARIVDRYRVTHHKDMVPHSPMHERFTHISGEYYQPADAVQLQACTGYEDPNCSYQWHITSIDDHLLYLGVVMGESGCSAM